MLTLKENLTTTVCKVKYGIYLQQYEAGVTGETGGNLSIETT